MLGYLSYITEWTIAALLPSWVIFSFIWRFMKKDGYKLVLTKGLRLFGIIGTALFTAVIRMGLVFVFGGKYVITPTQNVNMFFFLVLPFISAIIIVLFLRGKAELEKNS